MSCVTLRPRNRKRANLEENTETVSKRSRSKQTQGVAVSRSTAEKQLQPNPPNMQQFGRGVENAEPLSCRENFPPSVRLKGHAYSVTHQLSGPIPSDMVIREQLQENVPPLTATQKQARPSRKLPPSQCGRALASVVQPQFQTSAFSAGILPSPLPQLSWTDSDGLWQRMRSKDNCMAAPETDLIARHPCILPNMRTILLDWMLEVCEEYKQHRETFYLAVSIYDRFMDTQYNVQKERLQLIGITCLFISSKIEEIYPPKVNDFAYVTDGACTTQQILDAELTICKALNWRLSVHVTVNTWMTIYLQLVSTYFRPPGLKAKEFEYPAYSSFEFIRAMQLLDLCILNIGSRRFSSSILAASALFLISEKCQQHLKLISGLQLSDISLCIQWLTPFITVISRRGPCTQKSFKGVIPQDAHNIQTHEVTLLMLEEAMELQRYQEQQMDWNLSPLVDCSALMTPPRHERRCLAPLNSTTV